MAFFLRMGKGSRQNAAVLYNNASYRVDAVFAHISSAWRALTWLRIAPYQLRYPRIWIT